LAFPQGTLSGDKNELLFSKFSINYNNLPQWHRKGSILIWEDKEEVVVEEEVEEVKEDVTVVSSQVGGASQCQNESDKDKLSKREAALAKVEKKDVKKLKAKASKYDVILTLHEDIIRDCFWKKYPNLLK